MATETIGIIGQGFVGSSLLAGFKDDYNVLTYDINPDLCNSKSLKDVVDNCFIIFVCVPTPMNHNGSCYVGILEEVIGQIYEMMVERLLVIKSTIPPGTLRGFRDKYKLRLIYNPEFLTEANAVNDFKNQDRIILGVDDDWDFNQVANIYRKTFPLVPIIKTTIDEAIMVKYITNAFLSTKVIFANEMYDTCNGLNIDYDTVYSIARLDTRLGISHWQVPGPDGDRGFGGHCFPKDLNAIRYVARENNVDTELMDTVLQKNDKIRKNRDWEKQKGRAVV